MLFIPPDRALRLPAATPLDLVHGQGTFKVVSAGASMSKAVELQMKCLELQLPHGPRDEAPNFDLVKVEEKDANRLVPQEGANDLVKPAAAPMSNRQTVVKRAAR